MLERAVKSVQYCVIVCINPFVSTAEPLSKFNDRHQLLFKICAYAVTVKDDLIQSQGNIPHTHLDIIVIRANDVQEVMPEQFRFQDLIEQKCQIVSLCVNVIDGHYENNNKKKLNISSSVKRGDWWSERGKNGRQRRRGDRVHLLQQQQMVDVINLYSRKM